MGVRLHLELEIEPGFDDEFEAEGIVDALNNSQREGYLVELHLSSEALSRDEDNNEVPTYVRKVGIERTLD